MKSIWLHSERLPETASEFRITLGESHTPLLRSVAIGELLGLDNLYFKLENLNPTGSYKDRFASVLVSQLKQSGRPICISTSSGNTGASLAAYCAAAGLPCFIAVVDGAPVEKLVQMQLYGATICIVEGFGKDERITAKTFDTLQEIAGALDIPLAVSAYKYCPGGMVGVQTIAFEILDDLNGNVDHIFCPAGAGGLTLAVANGISLYKPAKSTGLSPAVHCVQPEGNNTIAGALRQRSSKAVRLDASTTTISGLQVPGILDGDEVIAQCVLSGGEGFVVSDETAYNWQKKLAIREGIFCEPAGAVSLSGLADAVKHNKIARDASVVCLVTGSGFKNMSAVKNSFSLPGPLTIRADELYKHVNQSMN